MKDRDTTATMMPAPMFCAIVFAIAGGCSNHGSVEVLESQLRDREDQIDVLRDELDEQHRDLRAAEQEAAMLRRQMQTDDPASEIELTNGVVRVSEIRVHPLISGPLDTDADGVADQLIVLIQPRDERLNVVETAGVIHVKLSRDKRVIQEWDISPEEANRHWRSNQPGSGIMLQLPLSVDLPSAAHVIDVRLSTANDRSFSAKHSFEAD